MGAQWGRRTAGFRESVPGVSVQVFSEGLGGRGSGSSLGIAKGKAATSFPRVILGALSRDQWSVALSGVGEVEAETDGEPALCFRKTKAKTPLVRAQAILSFSCTGDNPAKKKNVYGLFFF